MTPNELLFLTIPAALVAFKLALLVLAMVLVTRSVFKSRLLSQVRVEPMHTTVRKRDTLA